MDESLDHDFLDPKGGKSKFIILLVILVVVLSLASLFLYLSSTGRNLGNFSNFVTKPAISGTFDVNGVIPEGATITIVGKELGSTGAQNVYASGLPIADGAPWNIAAVQTGKSYQIQAQVIVNGNNIINSSPLTVTAPADEESLVLNIPASTQNLANAVISGNIKVDGFIPQGSTITIKGRKLGAQTFKTVAQSLPGQPTQFMSYATAVSGTTYEVEGILQNSQGVVIGTSDTITITAPAVNESLTINSSAAAPTIAPTPTTSANATSQPTSIPAPAVSGAAVSGSINFNGAALANTRIVVFEHPLNATNYQVAVDNITPSDGTTWSWTGASNATWYTMIAILKQRQSNGTDQDLASSAPITVASPATNVVFTINSGVTLSSPGAGISVACQTYNSGPNQNNWNVQVNFNSVPGAQSYWYQIGTSSGGNQVTNTTGNTNNTSSQQIGAVFNNSTTYYAQYAYANTPNVPSGSSQYSGFSSSVPLQCSH